MNSNTSGAKAGRQHRRKKRRSARLSGGLKKQREEIKEVEGELREKLEAIDVECEQLREETILVRRQSVNTQIRLALMFQILKAREKHDVLKASLLTSALRELIARDK
ncbi:uncharacterized protein LOC120141460 [Hibiscus syriacus]|uniref:uncharacterized protein LOC120141460 n=1 Tax=Hibiscus syriacus TaxID=106335 RepID=UPI0019210B0B|nr:uncharacterized protein LOC120141460 [Hibiscus syriacus]